MFESGPNLSEPAYASPETIQHDIVRTLGGSDPLPSVGAEGDLVRRIADLARTGDHTLLMEVGTTMQIRSEPSWKPQARLQRPITEP